MPPKAPVPGSGTGIIRPPASSTAANPSVPGPEPIPTEVISSTVDKSPSPGQQTLVLPQSQAEVDTKDNGDDDFQMDPGPSRPVSPPTVLPDLRHRPWPPGDDEQDDSSDEEDEVVARLPVYVSRQLKDNLHLFQYPLHTQSRPLIAPEWARERDMDITARVKESANRVEIEVPVDMDDQVWRSDEAMDMGFMGDANGHANGNGNGHDGVVGGVGYNPRSRREAWGDKMRLRSEQVPRQTGYFSGVIVEGALHLHPITNVYQMRTSLQYLDERDDRHAANRARGGMAADGDNDQGSAQTSQAQQSQQARAGASAGATPRSSTGSVQKGRKVEEPKDGTGSIKDFRTHLWQQQAIEGDDKYVPYRWTAGVHLDEVGESYDKITLDEEKRIRLKTTTRPLDYIDRVE